MSNEYKDYLWDHILDLALEYGLVDKITKVDPSDLTFGVPQFIWGTKNGQKVKLAVLYNQELGYQFEHRELER